MVPEQIEEILRNQFPEAIEDVLEVSRIPTFYIRPGEIVYISAFLKDDPRLQFDYLNSLTAVDWLDRFEVVYHLYSIPRKHHVTLKVRLDRENPTLPSVTSVWKAANWQEREVYDMFGIRFEGHPDLRRILLEEDWVGYPLRKDYVEE